MPSWRRRWWERVADVVVNPSCTARRKANELGIFRMALLTDDIDRDYVALVDAGVVCYFPPVELEMGPGLPSDLRALFFEDPDGTCVGLIEGPPV